MVKKISKLLNMYLEFLIFEINNKNITIINKLILINILFIIIYMI